MAVAWAPSPERRSEVPCPSHISNGQVESAGDAELRSRAQGIAAICTGQNGVRPVAESSLFKRGRFLFLGTRLSGISIPYHRNFEEVNLRFYVRRKDIGHG